MRRGTLDGGLVSLWARGGIASGHARCCVRPLIRRESHKGMSDAGRMRCMRANLRWPGTQVFIFKRRCSDVRMPPVPTIISLRVQHPKLSSSKLEAMAMEEARPVASGSTGVDLG
jgi:hypothetical protein